MNAAVLYVMDFLIEIRKDVFQLKSSSTAELYME